jgi:hypothetical protein
MERKPTPKKTYCYVEPKERLTKIEALTEMNQRLNNRIEQLKQILTDESN